MVEILSRNSRRVKHVVFMILAMDGFLIVITIIISYFLATENSEFLSHHPFPQQCLPCRDLALHPDDVLDGIVKSNNDTTCCASQKVNIPNLVDKVAFFHFSYISLSPLADSEIQSAHLQPYSQASVRPALLNFTCMYGC